MIGSQPTVLPRINSPSAIEFAVALPAPKRTHHMEYLADASCLSGFDLK
jgi:hypothetical protein